MPDEGKVLIQVDLAQAEARVVAWLAREERMAQILESGGDIHTQTASLIFGQDVRDLPPAEFKRRRYLGKKCVHAFNYGMSEGTFIDSCLLEADLVITLDEARRLRTSYFRAFSHLTLWHDDIKRTLRKTRRLISPYGRERAFHGRLDDELFREAYSFVPQATVADTLNGAWIELERMHVPGLDVLQQGHDSLLIQAPAVDAAVAAIRTAFDHISFTIHNVPHTIPYDIATGPNWRDMKDIDRIHP